MDDGRKICSEDCPSISSQFWTDFFLLIGVTVGGEGVEGVVGGEGASLAKLKARKILSLAVTGRW